MLFALELEQSLCSEKFIPISSKRQEFCFGYGPFCCLSRLGSWMLENSSSSEIWGICYNSYLGLVLDLVVSRVSRKENLGQGLID